MKFIGTLLKFLAFLIVMLVIVVSAEMLQNPAALRALNAWQKDTYVAVERFQPWTILAVYENALTGPTGMDIPLPDTGPLALHETGNEIHLGYWAHGWPAVAAIPLAAVDTVWHIVLSDSWLSRLVLLAQITMGTMVTILALVVFDPKSRMNGMWTIVILPLGVIVGGSVSSLIMQHVFEWGLHAFGSLTAYGGLCCATGGTAAVIYTTGVKLAEISAHGALESARD